MLSIIIPCYNHAEYLPDCLESCVKEDQCEVIVVDDGSTDNSLQIAKEYQEKYPFKVKVISQVNKGLASARNTGIMNAFYQLILPLDADDVLIEGAVKKILEVWQATNADVIGLSFKTFGKHESNVILSQVIKLEDFYQGNRLGYCSAIRKACLLATGGYSPKMGEGYEDLHLWVDLLTRGCKFITIQEPMWKYRTKDDSMYIDAYSNYHQKLLAQINKDFKINLNF